MATKKKYKEFVMPPTKHFIFDGHNDDGDPCGCWQDDYISKCPTQWCWCEKHQEVFVYGFVCTTCDAEPVIQPRTIYSDWEPSCAAEPVPDSIQLVR